MVMGFVSVILPPHTVWAIDNFVCQTNVCVRECVIVDCVRDIWLSVEGEGRSGPSGEIQTKSKSNWVVGWNTNQDEEET